MDCDKQRIAEYLNQLKDERDWTANQWEEQSGVPRQTISRLLTAQVDSPQFRTVAALAIAAGGSLDVLAGIPARVEIQKEYITDAGVNILVGEKEREITYLIKQLQEAQEHIAKLTKRSRVLTWIVVVFVAIACILIGWDLNDPRYGFLYRVGAGLQNNDASGLWTQKMFG